MNRNVDFAFREESGSAPVVGSLFAHEGVLYLRKSRQWESLGPLEEPEASEEDPTVILAPSVTVHTRPATAARYFLSAHMPNEDSDAIEGALEFLQDVLIGSFKTSTVPCRGSVSCVSEDGTRTQYSADNVKQVIDQLGSDSKHICVVDKDNGFLSINRDCYSSISVRKEKIEPSSED